MAYGSYVFRVQGLGFNPKPEALNPCESACSAVAVTV